MSSIKKILILFIFINFSFAYAKPVPESFADLAEKLMPSVVNISTTQTVRTTTNQFPFQFPPGSPFGEMFKDFERPTERKASSLGSGFVIDEKGIKNSYLPRYVILPLDKSYGVNSTFTLSPVNIRI